MNKSDLNKALGIDESFYNSYFSNRKITDIDKEYVETIVDYDSLSKVSRQLKISMGSMMSMLNVIAIILFIVIVYLLTKMIIEKSTYSISMLKVLGYSTIDISKIFIISTSIIVVLFNIIGVPIACAILKPLFEEMMRAEMSGWLIINVGMNVILKVMIYGILTYVVVLLLEYKKIQSIDLSIALKDRD